MFKVFDKENTGEIGITQVYDLLNALENQQNLSNAAKEQDKSKESKSPKKVPY